ncbi:MFS transporter [Nocardiopsis mangrovi]|uniref:MFS transporter n=1 Tax=Nocardiopsis mangrovi TaxID=1179818 RepID=A0ABV9E0S8_9ACTN
MVATAPAGFRRLLTGTALVKLGDGVQSAALPLLAASLTTNPILVAGTTVASLLPWLLVGLLAGATVDRANRGLLIAFCDVVRLGLFAGLCVALVLDGATIALVYTVAFLGGLGATFRDTASSTLVPELVPPDRRNRANGLLSNATNAGYELIGPPLGGYLFGVAVALPFALNGGLLAAGTALVCTIPLIFRPRPRPAHRPTLTGDIAAGLRWLAGQRRLRSVVALGGVLAFTDAAWFATLVLYVQEVLELPATMFGVLLAVGAVGGLAGGFGAELIARVLGSGGALLSAAALAAGCQLALGLTAHAVVAAVCLALSSFAFSVFLVVSATVMQTLTPPELYGRAISINRTLVLGLEPLGALVGGFVATAWGLRAPFLLGVPLVVLAVLMGGRSLRRAAPAG